MARERGTLEPRPRRDERAFLGEEFLTWLWWRAESGRAEFEVDGATVGITLDAPVLLRGEEDAAGKRPEQALRHGQPLRGAEAAAALRHGKRLARARLLVGTADREFAATFDAESFQLRSIAIPPPGEDDDPAERALREMAAFEEAVRLFDGLYRAFLEERLAPRFRAETLPKIRDWVAAK